MSATWGRIAFSSVGSYAQCVSAAAQPPHRRVEVLEALVGDERGDLRAEAARERVLVQHEHAAGLAHRLGDDARGPTVRSCAGRRSRRRRRRRAPARRAAARCTVAPHVTTVTRSPRVTYVPRPNGSIQSARRHRVAVVALPVEVLVLEEQHRVVACGTRCAAGPRRRAPRDGNAISKPGHVGEDRLAALAVPDRAALEVAADRDAHDHRARERAVRAPARRRRLRLELVHRRPHVVEELDLGARPQPAHRLADRAADDVRLGERRVEAAGVAERALQPERDAEHAALARAPRRSRAGRRRRRPRRTRGCARRAPSARAA